MRFISRCWTILFALGLMSGAIVVPRQAVAQTRTFDQAGQSQVWGERNAEAAGYGGSYTNMTTPDPAITRGFSNGPTGTSALTAPPFIEAGPTKACDRDCGLHPYSSAENITGNYMENVDTTKFLASGGNYIYKNYFIGNNTWEGQWCDANGCYVLADWPLGTSTAMPDVASGGEASCLGCPIGSLSTIFEYMIPGGTVTWTPWCYTAVHNTVGGFISACGPNQNWDISYP
jgi:hypothetical protein